MSPERLLRDQRGFSLIELLVVIIILGLIAGLVGPRLFGRVGQSKVAAARAQIELFGAALDQYRLDIGAYPPAGAGLQALVQNPNLAALERALSQEAGGAVRPLGPPLPVQVLPGRSRRLRHLDHRRRRRSRRRRRERRRHLLGREVIRGFSLMELVVVLAILAIAAAVVAPGVGRTADGVRARAEVGAIAAFLRSAREQAVTRRHAMEVRVDERGPHAGHA